MHQSRMYGVALALCFSLTLIPTAVAHLATSTIAIHLRWATFDPLQNVPSIDSTLASCAASTLRLVQFSLL